MASLASSALKLFGYGSKLIRLKKGVQTSSKLADNFDTAAQLGMKTGSTIGNLGQNIKSLASLSLTRVIGDVVGMVHDFKHSLRPGQSDAEILGHLNSVRNMQGQFLDHMAQSTPGLADAYDIGKNIPGVSGFVQKKIQGDFANIVPLKTSGNIEGAGAFIQQP